MNLYSHFYFNKTPSAPCVELEDGVVYTYQQVHERVRSWSAFFHYLGLKKQDRVMAVIEKSLDALCVYLAAISQALIFVPLNPRFQDNELAYFIADAKPALIFCGEEKKASIERAVGQSDTHIETIEVDGQGSAQMQLTHLQRAFDIENVAPNDIACILYTSGTTGQPKGAMLSHHNLYANANALRACWGVSDQDVLLHMLPIFHCHGLFFACNTVLLSGGKIILLPTFTTQFACHFLPKATVMMGVPTYYTRLLQEKAFDRELVKNMRLFISGSAPLLEKTFYEFEKRTGHTILERYGMTETGINVSNPLQGNRQPGFVGQPLSNVALRIVDENNQPVPLNEPGHIQIHSDNVFIGYWQKPHQTKESFTADGYFKTGDIGLHDSNGNIAIVGRAKDMIISGGMNVYPKEIESVIDALESVKESAVIGLPDADFGERVVAVVVLHDNQKQDEKGIIDHVKKQCANYKVPKQIWFVDALPRNAMGKVLKNECRIERM